MTPETRASLAVLIAGWAAFPAFAQPFQVTRFTIDAGGGTSSAGGFTVRGTAGQPEAGPLLLSAEYRHAGGFWGNASACPGLGPTSCSRADWDENGGVDFNDFLAFLNDFSSQAACADLTEDGSVDFNDLLEFLNLFNRPC
jgi:hypothetical protein